MTTINVKYAGTCRDCGETILPGELADWEKGQGLSCCAIGSIRMERITPETMEAYAISGDSLLYRETSYDSYAWMCPGCRLVWPKRHQADNCGERDHATSYVQTYDGYGRYSAGDNRYQRWTRRAIRREPS